MKCVLSFEQVACETGVDDCACSAITFTLRAGALAAVHVSHETEHLPLLDLATGLINPRSGSIAFKGECWADIGPFRQAALRGDVGCLPESNQWIHNLTVGENLVLRRRHHTTLTEQTLMQEAKALCRLAGCRWLPQLRTDRFRTRELNMLGWVRAFMGYPSLVILMFPSREVLPGWEKGLNALMEKALERQCAIMVVSDDEDLWRLPVFARAASYGIENGCWRTLAGGISHEE